MTGDPEAVSSDRLRLHLHLQKQQQHTTTIRPLAASHHTRAMGDIQHALEASLAAPTCTEESSCSSRDHQEHDTQRMRTAHSETDSSTDSDEFDDDDDDDNDHSDGWENNSASGSRSDDDADEGAGESDGDEPTAQPTPHPNRSRELSIFHKHSVIGMALALRCQIRRRKKRVLLHQQEAKARQQERARQAELALLPHPHEATTASTSAHLQTSTPPLMPAVDEHDEGESTEASFDINLHNKRVREALLEAARSATPRSRPSTAPADSRTQSDLDGNDEFPSTPAEADTRRVRSSSQTPSSFGRRQSSPVTLSQHHGKSTAHNRQSKRPVGALPTADLCRMLSISSTPPSSGCHSSSSKSAGSGSLSLLQSTLSSDTVFPTPVPARVCRKASAAHTKCQMASSRQRHHRQRFNFQSRVPITALMDPAEKAQVPRQHSCPHQFQPKQGHSELPGCTEPSLRRRKHTSRKHCLHACISPMTRPNTRPTSSVAPAAHASERQRTSPRSRRRFFSLCSLPSIRESHLEALASILPEGGRQRATHSSSVANHTDDGVGDSSDEFDGSHHLAHMKGQHQQQQRQQRRRSASLPIPWSPLAGYSLPSITARSPRTSSPLCHSQERPTSASSENSLVSGTTNSIVLRNGSESETYDYDDADIGHGSDEAEDDAEDEDEDAEKDLQAALLLKEVLRMEPAPPIPCMTPSDCPKTVATQPPLTPNGTTGSLAMPTATTASEPRTDLAEAASPGSNALIVNRVLDAAIAKASLQRECSQHVTQQHDAIDAKPLPAEAEFMTEAAATTSKAKKQQRRRRCKGRAHLSPSSQAKARKSQPVSPRPSNDSGVTLERSTSWNVLPSPPASKSESRSPVYSRQSGQLSHQYKLLVSASMHSLRK